MTKETITYTDLNGIQRTEDFYFDLSKPEIVKMQASAKGGYDVQLKSTPKKRDYLFGYDLVKATSSPTGRVTYPSDVDNATFTPAAMNFSTGIRSQRRYDG